VLEALGLDLLVTFGAMPKVTHAPCILSILLMSQIGFHIKTRPSPTIILYRYATAPNYNAVCGRCILADSEGGWLMLNAASRIFLAIGAAEEDP